MPATEKADRVTSKVVRKTFSQASACIVENYHVPDADRGCPYAVLGEKRGRARRVVHEGPPADKIHSGAAETSTGQSLLLCRVGAV